MQLRNLRQCRELAGLSQVELAAAAGVARGTVIRAENGYGTTPGTAKRMAVAIGVSIADLAGAWGGHAVGGRQGDDQTDAEWAAAAAGEGASR